MNKTAEKTLDGRRAQPHGGSLLSGGVPGNRGGTGRPPSAVRELCLQAFEDRIPIAMSLADDPEVRPRDRLAALELLARYAGLQSLSFDPALAAKRETSARKFAQRAILTP